MPGERWPDKRARAVLFAGARKLGAADPDAVADTGLAAREALFVDAEVREENADPQAHRVGYSADCMQFATLEPGPDGPLLGLWVGPKRVADAKAALGAEEDPNPFRRLYGWVRVPLAPGQVPEDLPEWVVGARRHAAETKAAQATKSL